MKTCYRCLAMLALSLSTCSSLVFAQHEHGLSDVEFAYADGKIVLEASVFEAEFGEGEFANTTRNPGFASEAEEGLGLNANNLIGYNVLDALLYWNGTEFASAGDVAITIPGKGGSADTAVSATSGPQFSDFVTPANLIDQADGVGDFHSHLDFNISEGAPSGGYGLLFSLSTDEAGIANSDPFGIFLNLGLEEEAFEAGVDAFAAKVPEPSSMLLVAMGIAGLGVLRRKR